MKEGMLTTCFLTLMCLCLMRTRAWWMDLSSFILSSASTPVRTRRRSSALPSNSLLGSFSSRVRSSLAAVLILARLYFTLQTSLLFLSPNSSDELELLVQPSLLERSPGRGVGLPKVLGNLPVDHLVLSVAHLSCRSESSNIS